MGNESVFRVSGLGPWWGRLGGVSLGAGLLDWPGGLAGFLVGAFVDRRLRLRPFAPERWIDRERSYCQRAELVCTFAVAGQMAKADGRVSEREIAVARGVMQALALSEGERRQAISMFNRGKQPGFPLGPLVRRFRRLCRGEWAILERFLDVQVRMALADGEPSERQLHVLQAVGACLRLSADAVNRRLRALSERMAAGRWALTFQLDDAFALLEVPGSARPEEIKRAYRRMIGRYHPDRLQGQGEPPEVIRDAAARTHQIRVAFEEIRRARGF